MADYKIPNLCGTSVKFNAIQSKFDTMIDNAIDGLEVDASALKATMDTDVTSLVSDLKALVPELPALPDVNLQGQLTSLSGLSVGSGQYNTLLADISSKFGSGLTAGGFSLDTLVSDAASAITGGTDLCSAVPNFSVPAAGGDAVQKAVEVLQAEVDSLPEEPSTLLANVNFTAAKTAVEETFTSYEEIGEEVPAEDIGPYRVAEETTEVAISSVASPPEFDAGDTGGSSEVVKIEATTPKNSVGAATAVTVEETTTTKTISITESGGEVTERKRSNVAKKGFTRRTVRITEEIKSGGTTITLKHSPIKMGFVRGWVPALKRKFKWRQIRNVTSRTWQSYADIYALSGNTLTIGTDGLRNTYGAHPKTGAYFKVTYSYLDNYDPNFAGPI